MDREKVIKGLECCMGEGQCCGMCDNCQYNTDKMRCDLATLHQEALALLKAQERDMADMREDLQDTLKENMRMAELLKAQDHEALDMPKPDSDIGCWYDITHNYTLEQVVSALKAQEPVEPRVGHDGWYRCGGCNNPLASGERAKHFYGHPWPKYCEECGRAVKWE